MLEELQALHCKQLWLNCYKPFIDDFTHLLSVLMLDDIEAVTLLRDKQTVRARIPSFTNKGAGHKDTHGHKYKHQQWENNPATHPAKDILHYHLHNNILRTSQEAHAWIFIVALKPKVASQVKNSLCKRAINRNLRHSSKVSTYQNIYYLMQASILCELKLLQVYHPALTKMADSFMMLCNLCICSHLLEQGAHKSTTAV